MSELKARLLAVVEEVATTKTSVLVTKRGAPVARLVPVEPPVPLEGSITFLVDDETLLEPLDQWEAEQA